jgi:hypothetical protein
MQLVKVNWSDRPAVLNVKGAEVSEIMWMDTQTEQFVSNDQFTVVKSDESIIDLINKNKIKKEGPNKKSTGPTKRVRAIAIYLANVGKTKAVIMDLIIKECQMSTAGASTYYYLGKAEFEKSTAK